MDSIDANNEFDVENMATMEITEQTGGCPDHKTR